MISVNELKNDINWIDECSKDLFYPKKILSDLIFSLEHFLPLVKPGSDYDKYLKDYVKTNDKEVLKLFEKSHSFAIKKGDPVDLQNSLSDWYKSTFNNVHILNIPANLLKDLNLDDNYCVDFNCPNLIWEHPSLEFKFDYEYLIYDEEDIDEFLKRTQEYKQKVLNNLYEKELQNVFVKAKKLLNLWIDKLK